MGAGCWYGDHQSDAAEADAQQGFVGGCEDSHRPAKDFESITKKRRGLNPGASAFSIAEVLVPPTAVAISVMPPATAMIIAVAVITAVIIAAIITAMMVAAVIVAAVITTMIVRLLDDTGLFGFERMNRAG